MATLHRNETGVEFHINLNREELAFIREGLRAGVTANVAKLCNLACDQNDMIDASHCIVKLAKLHDDLLDADE